MKMELIIAIGVLSAAAFAVVPPTTPETPERGPISGPPQWHPPLAYPEVCDIKPPDLFAPGETVQSTCSACQALQIERWEMCVRDCPFPDECSSQVLWDGYLDCQRVYGSDSSCSDEQMKMLLPNWSELSE